MSASVVSHKLVIELIEETLYASKAFDINFPSSEESGFRALTILADEGIRETSFSKV